MLPNKNPTTYMHFFLFLFFGGLPPSSQIITWRLILSYECLALAWLISSQLFLKYPVYLLPLGFLPLSISVYLFFPSYSTSGWVAGPWHPLLSLLLFFSFYFYSLPDSPTYPFSCLAIGHSALYLYQSGVLNRKRNNTSQS